MKTVIAHLCLAGSLVIIITRHDFASALTLFLLMGQLPGTTITLAPSTMLAFWTLIGLTTIYLLCRKQLSKYIGKRLKRA